MTGAVLAGAAHDPAARRRCDLEAGESRSPALAVIQTASCTGLRAGLIAADAALARGLVTAGDLAGALVWSGHARDPARVVEMADGRDALFREKRREDALRSLGFQVVQLTWRDLDDPASVARVINEAFLRR